MDNNFKPNLYSYIVKVDWGFSPNPFWGCCTLVCCKQDIRKQARVGDWVLGTGSVSNDYRKNESFSKKIIYAMEITKVVSMQTYYDICKGNIESEYYTCLKNKMPDYDSNVYAKKVGDCIYYDISKDYKDANLERGVHAEDSKEIDLSGENALISNNFFYFGKNAIPIPEDLLHVVVKYQGFKYKTNVDYVGKFIKWIQRGEFEQYRNPKNPIPILLDYKDELPKRQKNFKEPYTCDRDNEVKVIKTCR